MEVQFACEAADLPRADLIRAWVAAALGPDRANCGLVIRIVEEEEMRVLNYRFRGRNASTNVLSFPWEPPPGVPSGRDSMGDLVVCAPVVREEARLQGKPLLGHYAHMIVHGTLHLQGYEHQTAEQASRMESLETCILEDLGYGDPYRVSA